MQLNPKCERDFDSSNGQIVDIQSDVVDTHSQVVRSALLLIKAKVICSKMCTIVLMEEKKLLNNDLSISETRKLPHILYSRRKFQNPKSAYF